MCPAKPLWSICRRKLSVVSSGDIQMPCAALQGGKSRHQQIIALARADRADAQQREPVARLIFNEFRYDDTRHCDMHTISRKPEQMMHPIGSMRACDNYGFCTDQRLFFRCQQASRCVRIKSRFVAQGVIFVVSIEAR